MLRAQLWAAGFRPIPIFTHTHPVDDAGKRPLGKAWGDDARRDPPICVDARAVPHALNTGILCDGLRAIDVDIDDREVAKRVYSLAMARLGETIMRWRDDSARVLLLYRAADGQPPKRSIVADVGKVEILGKGQQFVAYGYHPAGGALLQWMPSGPAEVSLDDIVAVTEEQIQTFLTAAAALIGAKTPAPVEERRGESSGKLGADVLQVVAALSAIANQGPPDWEAWNRIGMATWAASGGAEMGRAAFHAWSQQNDAYDPRATNDRWDHYRTSPPTNIGAGTLFYEAKKGRAQPEPEAAPQLPPPAAEQDDNYWASLEQQAGFSGADWRSLEQRESGHAIPASPEARIAAGEDLLWLVNEAWEETAIPPRPWAVKGYLMLGAVSVISGPGSGGKSSLTNAYCCCMAVGRQLGAFKPVKSLRVMTYNVEDDEFEQKRRFSATFRAMKVRPGEAMLNIAIVGPTHVGTLMMLHPNGQVLLNTPVMDKLCAAVAAFEPDVLFLDPFVELHGAEENDNTAVRAVMARLRALAREFNIAVCVLHHSHKGKLTPGDPDSLRGASAIVGAARVVLTLNVMTEEEAEGFNLPRDQHRNYFRIDGAKSNYAPIEEAEWFERVALQLDNGDLVASAKSWKPPSLWAQQSNEKLNLVLDRIAAGPRPGVLYSSSTRGGAARWAGSVLIQELEISEPQAGKMIATWLKNGLLEEHSYTDPEQRKDRVGLVVNNTRRPS